MNASERFLVLLPLVLFAVLMGSFMITRKAQFFDNSIESTPTLQSASRLDAVVSTATTDTGETESCDCNFDLTIKGEDWCYNQAYPVMGGLDMVQFYSTFKNEDGTYDETQVGQRGSVEYSSVHQEYTYYFLNAENKATFVENPSRYIPQYGGFCSWVSVVVSTA